jgi:hypothetical protein
MSAADAELQLREEAEEAELIWKLLDEFVMSANGTDRDLRVARRARKKFLRSRAGRTGI